MQTQTTVRVIEREIEAGTKPLLLDSIVEKASNPLLWAALEETQERAESECYCTSCGRVGTSVCSPAWRKKSGVKT